MVRSFLNNGIHVREPVPNYIHHAVAVTIRKEDQCFPRVEMCEDCKVALNVLHYREITSKSISLDLVTAYEIITSYCPTEEDLYAR
ncbi:hypothetical protein AVEN_18682-1 [Araneus ventricosus]|uniref:Uncharacterized protein n=1 Tax=Araneus ventricosus TaxID=182803 RepID=A0A4Y2IBG8_ARAVE|nr:hypothetical protein AVEN_18682-1 [Araneus ventricosus]